MRGALAACVLAGVLGAREAHAGETRTWYGWQTLATDAPALAWSALALPWPREAHVLAGVGAASLMVSAPIVHGIHGHPRRAAGAWAMRAGAMLAGGILGAVVAGSRDGWQGDPPYRGAELGALAGGILAGALDAGILAWE